jgi:BirA family transcriptional regulator, biotin operon repressor / biotin---[acetyl-CoA-carboxylase] ligase
VADRPFLARRERFDRVGSTNDVVRGWLAEGTPEVCLAIADEQTAGRGREGRAWVAPPGAALLLSLGFRPAWLSPAEAWQVGALVSLAMAEAAEVESGLPAGTIRLKWPNDLVVAGGHGGALRKVAGMLGETEGLGTGEPRMVVGLGVNVDWDVADFPAVLAPAMSSLSEAAGMRIDRERVLERFLDRLEARMQALHAGRFDGLGWTVRQVTTGRDIRLETPTGVEDVRATGVDILTGALTVADPAADGGERRVHAGEIVHVRLAGPTTTAV